MYERPEPKEKVPAFNAQNFVESGGSIFHRKEGKCTVTVAYREDGNTTLYGATIHRRSCPQDSWKRKDHNQRAVERCLNAPLSMVVPEVEHVSVKEHMLRRQLGVSGCSAE